MKRLFPILLVATVIVGGALAFLIWRTTPMTADGYVASGKKYFEEKKYDEASVQLFNAVQLDPRNRDARYNLAQISMVQGDRGTAAGHLTSLLEHYPDDAEANVMLGNIHLAQGYVDQRSMREASDIAKKVLAMQPDFIPALLLSGNIAAGVGDFPTAVQAFNRIVTVDPQNASAYINLGAIHVLRKSLPEAEQAFLTAVKLEPKNKTAVMSLANLYRAKNEDDKAETVFKDGLALLPDDLMLETLLADLYSKTGRLETGVALLKDRIARNPQDPDTYFVLSDLYKSRNMHQQSRAAMEDAKKALPDNTNVAVKLASNFLATDRPRARAEVDQVLKANPAHPMGNLLLGQIQLLDGDIDKAEATLSQDILVRSGIPEAAFFRGSVAVRKGEIDKAVENFQRAVVLNPQYLLARVALGELLYGRGNIAAARAEVDAALAIQRSFIPGRLLKVAVDRAEENFTAAETELDALVRQAPDNAQVFQQLALTQAARGRYSDAERSFQRILDLQPGNPDALRGIVDAMVRTRQFDKAVRTVQALPDDKKSAFHYELIGVAYSAGGRNAEAEAAFRKAIEKEPKRAGSEALLAKHYISTGRMTEGLAELDDFATKVPNAAMAYGAKGLIYQQKGQIAEAKDSYEQALKADPNYDPAANNLAYILAEEGKDLDRALTLAQTARRLRPDSPSVADTLGWVFYKIGNHRQAREQLTFAVSRDPENPVLQYHLGMTYRANVQNREAEIALRKALSSRRTFKERPLAEAELKVLQQGN